MIQRFGFGFLRLNSQDFWQMTPREIFHALSFHKKSDELPLGREGFLEMARKFPDNKQ
ncbi:MAG: phage tail assembly chaperone [Rhizobiaceae bacterium]|nr:phage tail assembly chaperone [Rhizobiaceae bacterium]